MDKVICAGILAYKKINNEINFLLVHPGGPYWINKDKNCWQIPKGHSEGEEDLTTTAIREFEEETGIKIKSPLSKELGFISNAKKDVYVFSYLANINDEFISSNTCEIEYPPKSGKLITIPENDKGKWFSKKECEIFMNKKQLVFIELFYESEKV